MSSSTKSIVPQNQTWPGRAGLMEQIIKTAFQTPISALEIGVWYGVGSTNIWLNNLKENSSILLLDSWMPYSSESDLKDPGWNYKQMDDMSTDAFLSAFLNVKKFQSEQAHKNIRINMVRGESTSLLPLLKDDSLDFIYIDGDHKYKNVKHDIQQAKRLINKKFGVICGDDLEKLPTPELVALARQNTDTDFLRKEEFHPGVMLAISEELPMVHMVNGFWWIVCSEGQFNPNLLRPG
jgi:hypothetical protein